MAVGELVPTPFFCNACHFAIFHPLRAYLVRPARLLFAYGSPRHRPADRLLQA